MFAACYVVGSKANRGDYRPQFQTSHDACTVVIGRILNMAILLHVIA